MKKPTFNVMLDTRDDGTRVFTAKCLHCDAVIVGEVAAEVQVIRTSAPLHPDKVVALNREVQRAWDSARKHKHPVLIPDPNLTLVTQPEHGLQRALDAHIAVCEPRKDRRGL